MMIYALAVLFSGTIGSGLLIAFVIMILTMWATHLFILTFRKKMNLPLSLTVTVGVFVLGACFGLSYIFAIGLALFMCWRAIEAFIGKNENQLWIIYLVTIAALIFDNMGSDPTDIRLIIALFIVQTILVFSLQLTRAFKGVVHQKQRLSISLFLWLGIIFLTVFLLSFTGPYIGRLLVLGIQVIGYGFALIGQYAMFLFRLLIDRQAADEAWERMRAASQQHKQQDMPTHNDPNLSIFWGIASVLFALLLFLVILFIYKRIKERQIERALLSHPRLNGHAHYPGFQQKIDALGKPSRARSPKHPIRARVFHLQRLLKNKRHERHVHETIEDWFDRMPGKSEEKSTITSIYNKVRYGRNAVNTDDRRAFNHAMDLVKTALTKKKN